MQEHYRTLWISDTHLGGKHAKSEALFQFLKKTESDNLYLVGDIFDLWQLGKAWHWPEINDRIIAAILEKIAGGTRVVYLPGNHDAQFRRYCGTSINGIRICDEIIHETADGGRYLVLHGDRFDPIVQKGKFLAHIGSLLYEFLLNLNHPYNALRRRFRGKTVPSLSAQIKYRCKMAVNYIGSFETVLGAEVLKNRVDGVICGHIHHASLHTIGNFLYGNAGDWVESCTALAENHLGTIGIIDWATETLGTEVLHTSEHEKNRLGDRCLAPTN